MSGLDPAAIRQRFGGETIEYFSREEGTREEGKVVILSVDSLIDLGRQELWDELPAEAKQKAMRTKFALLVMHIAIVARNEGLGTGQKQQLLDLAAPAAGFPNGESLRKHLESERDRWKLHKPFPKGAQADLWERYHKYVKKVEAISRTAAMD